MVPGAHYEERCQQSKGCDPLLSPGEDAYEMMCSVQGSSVQERHGALGEGPEEVRKNDLSDWSISLIKNS